MSQPASRTHYPYCALCQEVVDLAVHDVGRNHKGAAEWLLGKRPNARLGRDTALAAIDYPAPNHEAIREAIGEGHETVYVEELSGDWVSATEVRKQIGASTGTVVRWWHNGDVEGRKAYASGAVHMMIREDERLEQRIEQYHEYRAKFT